MASMVRMEAEARLQNSLMNEFKIPCEMAKALAALVVYPTETTIAQVAFPCHSLAKTLKAAPQVIAERLAEDLRSGPPLQLLRDPRAVSGYLNFSVDVEGLFDLLERPDPPAGPGSPGSLRPAPKVDVEFSQPNTHKALHVGHLRNMIYGDAVCNLLEATGTRVVRSTFPGDLGAHVAKCMWYVRKFRADEVPGADDPVWLGRMYQESDAYLAGLAGHEEEDQVRKEIGEVLRGLESRMGEHYPLYALTREWSLSHFRAVYDWLGIRFDQWHFESECDEESRALVEAKFREGFFRKSQGAIGIDLSEFELGFAIFLKRDGTGLYITKDLALLKRKFADPEVGASIVVVDSRQKLHFKQLFKTAELMGYPQAKRSLHLSYEAVTDENGAAFSSRNRTGPTLEELREIMKQKVIASYLSGYQDQWSPEEIHQAAEGIVLGALKYGFLKFDAGKLIRFVMDDWIQMEGNTGPYLQYTYARCCSLLSKVEPGPGACGTVFSTEPEHDLILHLERFQATVGEAAREYRPSFLCTYLFELCRHFNRFYKECPIRTASDLGVRASRRALVQVVARTLKEGFGLLGIPPLERL